MSDVRARVHADFQAPESRASRGPITVGGLMSHKYLALAECPCCLLVVKATPDGVMRSHVTLSDKAGRKCHRVGPGGRPVERGTLGSPVPPTRPSEALPAEPYVTAPGFGGRYGVRPLD